MVDGGGAWPGRRRKGEGQPVKGEVGSSAWARPESRGRAERGRCQNGFGNTGGPNGGSRVIPQAGDGPRDGNGERDEGEPRPP